MRIKVRAKSLALHNRFALNFFVTRVSCEVTPPLVQVGSLLPTTDDFVRVHVVSVLEVMMRLMWSSSVIVIAVGAIFLREGQGRV